MNIACDTQDIAESVMSSERITRATNPDQLKLVVIFFSVMHLMI